MSRSKNHLLVALLCIISPLLARTTARADAVTDCSSKACEILAEAMLGTPPANRALAIVHTAVYEAVNAITKRYPDGGRQLQAEPGASIDAAIASACHDALVKLVPTQLALIDSAYHAALAAIAAGEAKDAGIEVGERAAAAILALRLDDGSAAGESYRPQATAGVYVPTVIPIVSQWPQRKPWLMTRSDQFRPGPPPALTSEVWMRDYNELKAIGAQNSDLRTAEQTEIARFWETTHPSVYHGVIRSVAGMPGREITQNARLFAAVTQAIDDAMISVFDAKYNYNFWRPITAIRNGDIDGNDATERDSSWVPFIETPMHPEYPCAHCIVAAAVSAVLQADISTGPMPTLTTTSTTAHGAMRSWTRFDDFVQEVANARIYDGVHYRYSTEVGTAMGKQVGKLAVSKYMQPSK